MKTCIFFHVAVLHYQFLMVFTYSYMKMSSQILLTDALSEWSDKCLLLHCLIYQTVVSGVSFSLYCLCSSATISLVLRTSYLISKRHFASFSLHADLAHRSEGPKGIQDVREIYRWMLCTIQQTHMIQLCWFCGFFFFSHADFISHEVVRTAYSRHFHLEIPPQKSFDTRTY